MQILFCSIICVIIYLYFFTEPNSLEKQHQTKRQKHLQNAF